MPRRGADDVFRELKNLEKKLRNKIIRQAQREAAKLLAAEVRGKAPIETGKLKRSVKVKAGKRKKDEISTVVQVMGNHDGPFVGFVEFGTKDHQAKPFIRQSVAAKRDEVIDLLVLKIDEGIRANFGH